MVNEIQQASKHKADQLLQLAQRVLPVKAGSMAKHHFQDNFRLGGFVNGGLHAWTPAKRLSSGDQSAASRCGTLMSSRKYLFSGLNYTPGIGKVTVYNDVPHAEIHNKGGTTHPRITPKMRRFAWAQYFAEAGATKKGVTKQKQTPAPVLSERAQMWRRIALTKKSTLTVHLPKRQFIGRSRELDEKITALINKEIKAIM
ncbi:MAG: hypothetical protein RR410_04770 [Alistipes sp.]